MGRTARQRAWFVVSRLIPLSGITFGVLTWLRLPHMHLQPALVGLGCWTVGNYVVCPLRWRAVSQRRERVRWYGRVYAEGELLGMLTPQHAGADIWRVRQLVSLGSDRTGAIMEVAADRLAGGVVIVALALSAGALLPARTAALALAGVCGAVGIGVVVVRRWARLRAAVGRLWARVWASRPRGARFARAAGVSALYQVGYLGFILGLVAAVGHHLPVADGAGLLGLAQAASVLPGVHGVGPKEGTLAGGLMAFGVPVSAALAAVALGAALTWVPAVAVGGTGLAIRSVRRRLR